MSTPADGVAVIEALTRLTDESLQSAGNPEAVQEDYGIVRGALDEAHAADKGLRLALRAVIGNIRTQANQSATHHPSTLHSIANDLVAILAPPRTCRPVYGSCGLESGHAGGHNAQALATDPVSLADVRASAGDLAEDLILASLTTYSDLPPELAKRCQDARARVRANGDPNACLRCGHSGDDHRLDDSANGDPTDSMTLFRCVVDGCQCFNMKRIGAVTSNG